MLFIAINGSSNKDGNTAFLLKKGLEQLELMGAQTGIIHTAELLRGMPVPFCTACSASCQGVCMKGTPMAEVLQRLREADGLLIGSSVYFGSVTGQLKAFWDKLRTLRGEKKLLNVVGGAVAVGASRFGGQEGTLRTIHEMMLVQGMTIIGGGQKDYDCGHYGVAAQRPATEDQYAQQRIMIMAKRLFEVSQATASLRL